MKKKLVFLFIFILIVTINITIYAKYVIEYDLDAFNIQVDSDKPEIQLVYRLNTNNSYGNYANKTHTIRVRIKIIEKNIKENNFDENHVRIIVGENEMMPEQFKIEKLSEANGTLLYSIEMSGISGNGNLNMKINEGAIIDISNNTNEETIFDLGIQIDNIPPVVTFKQQEIADGKINANIGANEKIRPVSGWNLSADKLVLTKEFECNSTYPFKVTDYAGNQASVDINITKATNIKLIYGSLAEGVKWSFGYGNNETVGDKVHKTEMICLNYEGNINQDFIQIQNYVYTHWGEGKRGIGYTYENRYVHGYNPSESKYADMTSNSVAYVNRKLSIILGGDGVNKKGYKGIDNGEAIPEEIAKQNLYGVSGLRIKLKDYSKYSILYQIWIEGSGWQKPVSDGELAMASYNKPFSAYRLALIPGTEKQYLMELWNREVGK